MNLYNKIFVPVSSPVPVDAINVNGFYYKLQKKCIVLTENELLDLMQESVEHSYPTLLREKAIKLLNAKLANQ